MMFHRFFNKKKSELSASADTVSTASNRKQGSGGDNSSQVTVGSSASLEFNDASIDLAIAAVGGGSGGCSRLKYPLDPVKDAALLVVLTQQYSISSIAISHYRVKENYVEYVIECTCGHSSWRVYRRYQQFKNLDSALKQLYGGRGSSTHGPYGVLPLLPSSHWMEVTNQNPELVEQRRGYLEIYLQQLLVPKNLFYVARTALYSFLHEGEVPTHVPVYGLRPLLGLCSTGTGFKEEDDEREGELRAKRLAEQEKAKEAAAEGGSSVQALSDTQRPDSPSTTSTVNAVMAAIAQTVGLHDGDTGSASPAAQETDGEDTASWRTGESDERLPPPSAHCQQCQAEFTSFLYPHRCFFCRHQYCTTCLCRVELLEKQSSTPADSGKSGHGKGSWTSPLAREEGGGREGPRQVPACRRCTENYQRRMDRCVSAPGGGGGAYLGMQSTLSFSSPSSSNLSSRRMSGVSSPAPACFGAETSPALQHRLHGPNRSVSGMSPTTTLSNAGGGGPGRPPMPEGGGNTSMVNFEDFQLLTVIGRGTFGKVFKVRLRESEKVYAMKVMNKATVYKRCMTSYIKEERTILMGLKPNPYVVRCHYAFQSSYYLYFVLDFLPGGELYDFIYPTLRLSPEAARLCAAELVVALEHLHKQDVVHRDIKPENIVLTSDGHICLTDFGLARRNFSRSRRRSFVGSPEYVPPETIQGEVQTAAVDWWSFGVLLYELMAGHTPFHAHNNNAVYDNVLHKDLVLPTPASPCQSNRSLGQAPSPPSMGGTPEEPSSSPCTTPPVSTTGRESKKKKTVFTPEAASLLYGLLTRDPAARLRDAATIKAHPYFAGLDWVAIQERRGPAPCPTADLRDNDTRYFKQEFTSEWASVPIPTNTTRASAEALTKCFDNFPVSNNGRRPSPSLSMLPPAMTPAGAPTLVRGPLHCASQEQMLERLRGAWRAVSIEERCTADGRVIYPWGGAVDGLLTYLRTAEGHDAFSLQLTPVRRRPLGPTAGVTQLTKEELCDAYSSYTASFGRFHLSSEDSPQSLSLDTDAQDCEGDREAPAMVVTHVSRGNYCPNLMDCSTSFRLKLFEEREEGVNLDNDGKKTEGADSEGVGEGGARRLLLQLTTRAQRSSQQKFLAQTTLLFEKVAP